MKNTDLDINDLIDKAGGPKAIAEASQRTPNKISYRGVQQWRRRGIPDTYYDLMSSLTRVKLETIYRVNRSFRSGTAA